MSNLQQCKCGFGNNWFCYPLSVSHEYNSGPKPTARYHADRKPEATVFGHISEKYACAYVNGFAHKEAKFYYKDYPGTFAEKQKQAIAAAIQWVEVFVKQTDLFKEAV